MKKENQSKTKKCPFCAEEIQFDANKCKHCGEWLNKKLADEPQPYNEYPKNWDEIRKYVYKRDNYTCKGCGATDVKLYAHHIVPLSSGGSNTVGNLTTLCERCHNRIHPHIEALHEEGKLFEALKSHLTSFHGIKKPQRKDSKALDVDLEYYNKKSEMCLHDPQVWYDKAGVLIGLGKYEEAISCYDKAIEINPKKELFWIVKGDLLENLGRYEEAISCYDKAIEINPNDPLRVENDRGILVLKAGQDRKIMILKKLGRYEEAILCERKRDEEIERDIQKSKSECFIATAAYGTPFVEEINILRHWRDSFLLKHFIGRLFIKTYYKISPPIAEFISKRDRIKVIIRIILNPHVKFLKYIYKK